LEQLPGEKWTPAVIARDSPPRDSMPEARDDIS
jgi:hypothetical protein